MHSAVSKMPSVVSLDHSFNHSNGYQTPDRTYALKALRSSAGLLVEPSTESMCKKKEDLSENYLKELLESLIYNRKYNAIRSGDQQSQNYGHRKRRNSCTKKELQKSLRRDRYLENRIQNPFTG